MSECGVTFGWVHAGLVTIWIGDWTAHLFPLPWDWQLGYLQEEYDSRLQSFGFGPFLLICWMT